jgi:hypothetical protein
MQARTIDPSLLIGATHLSFADTLPCNASTRTPHICAQIRVHTHIHTDIHTRPPADTRTQSTRTYMQQTIMDTRAGFIRQPQMMHNNMAIIIAFDIII